MRILVEAFACRPGSGSEDARGWSYPEGFARRGHEVTVITSPQACVEIEAALAAEPLPGLRFAYVPRRRWPLRLGWTVGSAVQYVLWLWKASELARRLDREASFDVVHHAGYGTVLGGTFLWRLGRPLVFGPAGGGQTTPPAFRAFFGPWWRSEALRSLVVRHLWRLLWHARETTRRAAVVLAGNEETVILARRMGARRVRLMQDGAVPSGMLPPSVPERPRHEGLRLLWLGRIMPRKAVELAVLAVEGLPEEAGVTLTIVGCGANDEMEASFRRWLAARPVAGRVTAPGAVPFGEVPAAYLAADAFIFTSVRDTVGMQVLEAMAFGLPVICLDHQGVRSLVPDDGGVRVPVSDIEGTVAALRDAILLLATDHEGRIAMGAVNYERVRDATWQRHADDLLGTLREVLERDDPARAPGRGGDVARYVTTNAGYPDKVTDFTRDRYAQFAARLPRGARRVLDLGCATGRGGEALLEARPGLEIVGVDVLAERLREAETRGYAATWCASATNLPLDDGVFDAVVAGEVIEHVEEADVDLALEEIRRVLRPGGVVMLTTPNPNALRLRLRGQTTLGHSHLSEHTARSLRRRLLRHGFTGVAVIGSGRATRLFGERFPLTAYGSYLVCAVRAR